MAFERRSIQCLHDAFIAHAKIEQLVERHHGFALTNKKAVAVERFYAVWPNRLDDLGKSSVLREPPYGCDLQIR